MVVKVRLNTGNGFNNSQWQELDGRRPESALVPQLANQQMWSSSQVAIPLVATFVCGQAVLQP